LERARRLERIKNLDSVYSYFSRDCSCPAEEAPQNTNPSESAGEKARINRVKDFCFLSSGQIKIIKTRVADIMKSLEDEYGSLRMVSEHYQELIRTGFAESYPFPKGFFSALTVLESHGPPKDVAKFLKGLPPEQQKEREKFIEEVFNKKTFAAAFVLGYFT